MARVIDWEFAMTSLSYFDLAYFIASARMDDKFSPGAVQSNPSFR